MHVLVAAARHVDEHNRGWSETGGDRLRVGHSVSRLESGQDPLETRQILEGLVPQELHLLRTDELRSTDYVPIPRELPEPLVPLDEIPATVAGADVGLVPFLPERFTETILPTKLLEYARLGVPAVEHCPEAQ